MWGLPSSPPGIAELAARARQAGALEVILTIEVSGPDGSRKSKVHIAADDLSKMDAGERTITTMASAIGAYERLASKP